MNHDKLLATLQLDVKEIPITLTATKQIDFLEQFRSAFSCPQARTDKGVVYVWSTKNQIPRLKSSSNVVYIGKTITSLFYRHHKYAATEAGGENDYNWRRYEYIIKDFGPISISYVVHPLPDKAERDLLKNYFDEHLEIPPLNRQG